MYILAFDTTAAACSIVLLQDGKVLSRYHEIMDFGQAEVLIPQIQKMLVVQNLKFSDINLFKMLISFSIQITSKLTILIYISIVLYINFCFNISFIDTL